MRRLILLSFGLILSLGAQAQLPNTQVYVFDFAVRDTAVTLTNPLYLTGFNENGYNNQPGWIDRNSLLMSIQPTGADQPDVYKFDLARSTRTRMTATQAGEYSPKIIGTGDRFSAIRQEYAGRDTVLRLWEFPMNLENNGKPVFTTINGVGYYEWLNSIQLALFMVQNPSKLVMASADAESPRQLADQVGRCFRRQPNGNLAFVDKSTLPWSIMEKNLYRLDEPARKITTTPDGAEDFAILPDGSYLMGQGSKLLRYDAIRNPRWVEVSDLRLYGITNITRIEASSFGRLALVSAGRGQ